MTRSRKFEGRRRAIPSRELRIKKGGKVWVAVPLESVQRGQQLARLESPKGYSFVNYPTKTAGSSHAPCRYQPPSPWEARIELQDFSVRLFFLSNVPLLLLTILEKSCVHLFPEYVQRAPPCREINAGAPLTDAPSNPTSSL